jgi:hypothetical protein
MTTDKSRRLPRMIWVGCITLCIFLPGIESIAIGQGAQKNDERAFDIIVYGGTSAGVVAAVQAGRMGKTVLLIEPGKHLGGMTSSGLGHTDIGNHNAVGGIAREFYGRIHQHYSGSDAWKWESSSDYAPAAHTKSDDLMWNFEPHVAETVLDELVRQTKNVTVVRSQRLIREYGVIKSGTRILTLWMESGEKFSAKQFIDATYEGDLMAAAGVSFAIGREPNQQYSETLNGSQVARAKFHQLQLGVEPFLKKGNAASGRLPHIETGIPKPDGSGDHRVQAYNFRLCLTDVAENRIEFEKPSGYDEQEFELLFRNFEAGERRLPLKLSRLPNRKTDVNNNLGFSTDYIGQSYEWPHGEYSVREQIFADHVAYTKGLLWTLANHERVPADVREQVSRLGLAKDEFTDSNGWPHQLYVREGRRMVAAYVMTQHDCSGHRKCGDPVGLGSYTMDSHHVRRYVDQDGFVQNEGDVQVGGFAPYPISFRSIVPDSSDCENLVVPVCISSTHIAFGSIRMEPVFMILGQSAATIACLAIDQSTTVQNVEYDKLSSQLLSDGQKLQ